jgi:MYXO-CTERM domain-containing protein
MPPIAPTDFWIRRWRGWHIAVVTVVLGLVVTGQVAAYDDLRSPDSRDTALQRQETPKLELRSPDTRDAALQAQQTPTAVDVRSPDTRDLAQGRDSAPSPAGDPSGDFSWVYLAVGLALVAVAAIIARRRRVKRVAIAVGR